MLDLAVEHIKGLQNEVQVRKFVMLSYKQIILFVSMKTLKLDCYDSEHDRCLYNGPRYEIYLMTVCVCVYPCMHVHNVIGLKCNPDAYSAS